MEGKKKKEYNTPKITRVELASEISAKSGCKMRSSGSATGHDSDCNIGGGGCKLGGS
jgi:hypothetical protein